MDNEKEVIDEEVISQKDDIEEFLKKIFSESENNNNIINFNKIINNQGVYTGDGATIDNIQMGMTDPKHKKKEAVFSDVHLLNEWMDKNYASHDMAIMFSIIFFEGIAYKHIISTADMLYQLLNLEREREEVDSGLTYIMECLGAYRCSASINTNTGRMSTEVVKLSGNESRKKLLENIWLEYPKMHKDMVIWLMQVYAQSQEVVRQKCVEIFIWIAMTDEYFFYQYMTDLIRTEKNIDIDLLFSRVFLGLLDYESYSDRVYRLLLRWSTGDNAHYLLCCLLVDAKLDKWQEIMENAIRRYIENLFIGHHMEGQREFYTNLYYFYFTGLRRYKFYKIVIEELYDRSIHADTKETKETLVRVFYLLLSIDIRQVNWEKEDAILVMLCFKESEIKYKLYDLWRLAWDCKKTQNRFYDLMANYENKVINSGKESRLEEFVHRILHGRCTKEWQKEICYKIRRRIKNGKNYNK